MIRARGMGDHRGTLRYEEDSARGSNYPLLRRLGPASRPGILAKTPRSLNLGTSENLHYPLPEALFAPLAVVAIDRSLRPKLLFR